MYKVMLFEVSDSDEATEQEEEAMKEAEENKDNDV